MTLVSDNPAIVQAPADAHFDLRHATYDFVIKGGTVEGTAKIRKPPECALGDASTGTLAAGSPKLNGQGSLAKAYVSAPSEVEVKD